MFYISQKAIILNCWLLSLLFLKLRPTLTNSISIQFNTKCSGWVGDGAILASCKYLHRAKDDVSNSGKLTRMTLLQWNAICCQNSILVQRASPTFIFWLAPILACPWLSFLGCAKLKPFWKNAFQKKFQRLLFFSQFCPIHMACTPFFPYVCSSGEKVKYKSQKTLLFHPF